VAEQGPGRPTHLHGDHFCANVNPRPPQHRAHLQEGSLLACVCRWRAIKRRVTACMSEAWSVSPFKVVLLGGAAVLGAMIWWKATQQRTPRAAEMTGQVAIVTGGTSGVGSDPNRRNVK
jgi:hypothetical protein